MKSAAVTHLAIQPNAASLPRSRAGAFRQPARRWFSGAGGIKQKRYSLLFESGDRAVDYRMFGLWTELGKELQPPGDGPQVIPFPSAEINARINNLACS